MIIKSKGDVDRSREMMRWLHANVASASKPDLAPSYASFLNSTVRWDAANGSWYVSCNPRLGTIEIMIPDDDKLMMEFRLTWT